MQDYYNFTKSANQISFDPYWHDKSNFVLKSFLGILILALGAVASNLQNLKSGIVLSILISLGLLIHGIYILKVRNKTTFVFDKIENAFFKITPFGKRKITSLDNIIDIITKSGSSNFSYILTVQNNNSIKKIYLTATIKNESQSNPEVRYLEMQIIPQLESFLNLNKEVLILFDPENCSPI